MAMTYTSCQESPDALRSFLVIQVRSKFVPVLMLFLDLLVSGIWSVLISGSGYLSAHLYLFLNTLWPLAGGPQLLHTPQMLRLLFRERDSRRPRKGNEAQKSQRHSETGSGSAAASGSEIWKSAFQGTGRRLGSG
jgi:hypothetical protein